LCRLDFVKHMQDSSSFLCRVDILKHIQGSIAFCAL
jgi:hypothetical protein